jgi:hypothetical protein
MWGTPGCIQAVLGGLLLVFIGLAGGVLMGLLAFSSSSVTESGLLRKASTAAVIDPNELAGASSTLAKERRQQQQQQQHHQDLPHAPASQIVNKVDFLQHEMVVGTSGAFPYYPDDGMVPTDYDFSSFQAEGGSRYEEYKHGDSPYSYSPNESDGLARSRRFHVKKAMQHAWSGYTEYAWGCDELKPQSMRCDNGWGGIGIQLVDALDTLWLMNMTDEFYKARDWCRDQLDHNIQKPVSVFETTIRSLGGLLAAYDWSGDEVFLNQAKDLGSRLFKAFKTPTGIPTGQVNLATGQSRNIGWTGNSAITAEFATLQIEFRTLARLTGIVDYKEKSERVFQMLKDMNPKHGLYPYFIRNQGDKPEFGNDKITFGAMSDSFYEYMLKIWLQGGRTEPMYREMYDNAIQGMHDELLTLSSPSGLVFIADKNNGRIDTKMDHLVCFMGGLLALGAYTDPQGLLSERAQRDLKTAKVRCNLTRALFPT